MNTASKTPKLSSIFLVVSVISGLVGFSDMGPPYLHGLGRALCAVFFILYMIFTLLKDELMDAEIPVIPNKPSDTAKPDREMVNRH